MREKIIQSGALRRRVRGLGAEDDREAVDGDMYGVVLLQVTPRNLQKRRQLWVRVMKFTVATPHKKRCLEKRIQEQE